MPFEPNYPRINMGCTASREDQPPEERAIAFAEAALGFENQAEERIDYIVRKYSSQNSISLTQFRRIVQDLHLRVENYGPHSKISNFYDAWRDENAEISRKDFLVLALLLCHNHQDCVAQLLFQSFDEAAEKTITVDALQELLQTMLEVSLRTANLVVDHQTSHSNEAKAMYYMQKLKSAVPQTVNTLAKAIPVNDEKLVTEESFVDAVFSFGLGSCGGCRKALRKQVVTDLGPPEFKQSAD